MLSESSLRHFFKYSRLAISFDEYLHSLCFSLSTVLNVLDIDKYLHSLCFPLSTVLHVSDFDKYLPSLCFSLSTVQHVSDFDKYLLSLFFSYQLYYMSRTLINIYIRYVFPINCTTCQGPVGLLFSKFHQILMQFVEFFFSLSDSKLNSSSPIDK